MSEKPHIPQAVAREYRHEITSIKRNLPQPRVNSLDQRRDGAAAQTSSTVGVASTRSAVNVRFFVGQSQSS